MEKSVKRFFIGLLHRALIALLSGEENQYEDYWQWRFIDWTKIGSPWRMSKAEECRYEEIMQSKKVANPKILILGATPAFRMIGGRIGAEVACADFSLPMLREMGKFVEKEIPGATKREIWFVGDWLKIPFPENYFDFVLGDMALPFVSRGDRERFLQKIKKTLSSEGLFITRAHVIDENLGRKTIEECLETFFRSGGEAPQLLNVFLLDWSFEQKTGLTNRKKIIIAASDYLARCADQKTRQLLNDFLKKYASGIDFNFENRNILERDLNRHFVISKTFTADDYRIPNVSNFYPTYALKKK